MYIYTYTYVHTPPLTQKVNFYVSILEKSSNVTKGHSLECSLQLDLWRQKLETT